MSAIEQADQALNAASALLAEVKRDESAEEKVEPGEAEQLTVDFVLNPEVLDEWEEGELRSLDMRLHALFASEFEGAEDVREALGVTREQVVAAHRVVLEAMSGKGVEHHTEDRLTEESQVEKSVGELLLDSGLEPIPLGPGVILTEHEEGGQVLVTATLSKRTLDQVRARIANNIPVSFSKRVDVRVDKGALPLGKHSPLYDLVLVPRSERTVVQRAQGGGDDPTMRFPSTPGPEEGVIQVHFRGDVAHLDLRMALDETVAVGWTLAFPVPEVEVDSLEVGRKIADELELTDQVVAVPKKLHSVRWIDLGDLQVEAGDEGSSKEDAGVFIELATLAVEWGMQTPTLHEYFLTGQERVAGRLVIRFVQQSSDDEGLWIAGLSESALPMVLTMSAVDARAIPPLGHSGMPASLMAATPEEFRFWEAGDLGAAREMRDSLVKAEVFTEDTVVLDEGNIRLVSRKLLEFPAVTRKQEDHVHPLSDGGITGLPLERPGGHVHMVSGDMKTGLAIPRGDSHVHVLPEDLGETGPAEPPPQDVDQVMSEARKIARTAGDGTQVWDPSDVRDSLDLRPPAVFDPMRPGSNEGARFDSVEAAVKGAFPDLDGARLIREGVQVEPNYSGFRVVVQRCEAGLDSDVTQEKVLIFSEAGKLLATALPELVADVEKMGGSFVLDGHLLVVDSDGQLVDPAIGGRLSKGGSALRLVVHDALYLPNTGNLTQTPLTKRRRKLEQFIKSRGTDRMMLSPRRHARSRAALKRAMDWAAAQPGSKGAVLKQVGSAYTLGDRVDTLVAKVDTTRRICAKVLDKLEVSPGVFDYVAGIGPVDEEAGDMFADTVVVDEELFVMIGGTGEQPIEANVGDCLAVKVDELLWKEGPPVRVRWFNPKSIQVVSEPPFSIDDVRSLVMEEEIEKHDAIEKLDARERHVRVIKAEEDQEERYVLGVVLEPDVVDSQGDTYTADEVRKAAHSFMEFFGGKMKLMHKGAPIEGVKVLETYLTKSKETHGQQTIGIGTWLLAVRVVDDELWEAIKRGDFTGFSIGGTALRERIGAAA